VNKLLQPFSDAAVMGACPSAALTETVASVAALRGCSLRRCRAVLRALYCCALAVDIGAVVRTLRLRLLLLWRWLGGRWLRSLRGERSEQYRCERKDGNESANEKHARSPSLFWGRRELYHRQEEQFGDVRGWANRLRNAVTGFQRHTGMAFGPLGVRNQDGGVTERHEMAMIALV
jgi:hypothetical protein